MSSIVKTVLTLSAGVGIATSAVIIKNHPITSSIPQAYRSQPVSPIIIDKEGKVRFLGRIPPISVATEIRLSAKSQDFERLNQQLMKHKFYVIPESANPAKNL